MRTVLLVAGAWLALALTFALAVGWVASRRIRRDARLEERLSELVIRDRLRPRSGNVEAAPIAPPIGAPAPITSNGRRR